MEGECVHENAKRRNMGMKINDETTHIGNKQKRRYTRRLRNATGLLILLCRKSGVANCNSIESSLVQSA